MAELLLGRQATGENALSISSSEPNILEQTHSPAVTISGASDSDNDEVSYTCL